MLSHDDETDFWTQSREGWLEVSWPRGVVLRANEKSCELCCNSRDALVGEFWWELFEPDSSRRLRKWVAEWQRGNDVPKRAGLWLRRSDETTTPITLRAVRPSSGALNTQFLVLEDRREQQALAQQLDWAEARLEETQRVARLGWWEWDIKRDAISWSNSLSETFGVPSSKIGGRLDEFLQGVHADDRAQVKRQLEAVLARGERYVAGFRAARADGATRHMHMQGRLERDANDNPLRLFGTCQDVTDRIVALNELRESETKYRNLVETSSELIWSVDEQGRLTYVNQAIREIYGYEPEEILGQVFSVLLSPERLPPDWEVFQKVMAGIPAFHYETIHLRKDGQPIDLSFNAIAKKNVGGQVVGATGTASDITARKRQEAQLRERESWFRAIFENAPQCVMILSLDGKLLDINLAGLSVFDVTSSNVLVGREAVELLEHVSQRAFQKALAIAQAGESSSWQAQVLNAQRNLRWLEGQLVPLRAADGQIIRLLATAQDVTARRMADAFRDGEQQVLEEIASGEDLDRVLRTFIRMIELQLPRALCAVLLLSDDAQRLTLRASSELPPEVSQQLMSVVVAADAPSFAEAALSRRRRIVEDTTVEPSWHNLRSWADQFQLRSCWAQPIRGLSDEVFGVLAVFFQWPRSPSANELQLLDTAAYLAGIALHRTRAEQALRDSEKRFRTLFEHSPDAIFVESLTGLVLDVNPAACQLHSMARGELIGKHVLELVPPRVRDEVTRDFARLASGEIRELEGLSWNRERGEVPISLHVSKTEYAFQAALLFHVRDISERKAAEDKAREAQAHLAHVGRLSLMGELMAGISHEINQPLFAIANFANACETVLKDGKLDQIDKVLDWTHKIAGQANRAGEIIRRMRDFSRKSTPHRSTVDVQEMVIEATELVVSETKSQRINLKCEFRPDQLLILADRIQIQQTLVNLLRNAYRAMAENSVDDRHVLLLTQLLDGMIQISVQDNGHGFRGVSPEEIFNPFFTTKPDGLGLGLTISRSIIEAHGGKLWATQNAERGATFLLTLPVEPNHAILRGLK